MSTRRTFLASVAGTVAVSTLAGCLSDNGDGDNDDADEPNGEDVWRDDELLTSLANPTGQVFPRYFAGYRYDVDAISDGFDYQETIPRLGSSVAGLFDEQLAGVEFSDLGSMTGSVYNAWSSGGALSVQPGPSGQTVHVAGSFEAGPVLDLLDESEAQQPIGDAKEYERYVAETRGGAGFETWAVQDGHLIIVSRSDIPIQQQEGIETAAGEALESEFEQVESDDAPIADAAPAFAESVGHLGEAPIRGGAAFALIPVGSDTGVQAFDDAIRGIVGAGVSVIPSEERSLQRAVTYLDTEMASEESVTDAYESSETEEIPFDSWEFSTRDATVTARASLTDDPAPAMYQTGLPVPGYQSIFTRINPEGLGRAPTPRVFFQPEIGDDGSLRITHTTGGGVTDLQVRYIDNGEVQHESWDGEITQGDTFTSDGRVDAGTQSWVTWRPDTVDAAVLIRFQTGP